MPGMTWPVVKYAPTAATKPTIARRPFSFSDDSLNPIVFLLFGFVVNNNFFTIVGEN